MDEHLDYRVVFVLPETRDLVTGDFAVPNRFPVIRVPQCERPAEYLNSSIKELWGIESIVLDTIYDDRPDTPCAVIEVRTSGWNPVESGFRATDLNAITDDELGPSERTSIHSILSCETSSSPFSRLGWIGEAQAWVAEIAQTYGNHLTGEILQLNAGGPFCLVRFAASSGTGYWLKAVGGPNLREFGITTYLSQVCPQYLPKIVAIRKDWNAWLMEEHGQSLSDSESIEDFLYAVRNMAQLQMSLLGETNALLALCCGDHRVQTMESGLTNLIDFLEEAMALQTSTKVAPLSSSRLRELETALRRACTLQQQLYIPDTLMHCDISRGSILSDGTRYVFTDWCEANVGNPFITLEQLCIHATKKCSLPEVWFRKLRNEYRSCWLDLLNEEQIDHATQLAPLLSLLSTLHRSSIWRNSPKRYDSHRLSYARSLARHVDRVVQTASMAEALCL